MTYTPPPATVWSPDDGLGEYSASGANYIVDESGDNLVDPDGNYIVDTGTTFTPQPETVWTGDDSI